jgi:CubicO group peptidase (beta-lactamase class C family)
MTGRSDMKKLYWGLLVLAVIATGWSISCNNSLFDEPEDTGDGWATASLESVGMDEEVLWDMMDRIENETYQNIHGIVIIKDGTLVFEEYFNGYTWAYNSQFRGDLVSWDRDMIHNLASVTKSFTSTLIGIAMDRGLYQGVGDNLIPYFPEYEILITGEKEDITLEHLLTMRAGLEWNEGELPYSDPNNDLVRLFSVSDPVRYILEKPLIHTPGTVFYYSGGCTNLLGESIRSASGIRMDAFAGEYLFEPLGITNYAWDFINSDFIHASGNLKLRPRDMAKLGYLFLNGGNWKGNQIVSETWVDAATTERVSFTWGGYGYQWWMQTFHVESVDYDVYYAAGWGGQKIYVIPDAEMVVVFTGGNYITTEPTDQILSSYVLKAL